MERAPEVGHELRATVGNDFVGNAVQTKDVLEVKEGRRDRANSCIAGNEMGLFGETVDDDKNGVEEMRGKRVFGRWKVSDKVHINAGPWAIGHRQGYEFAVRSLARRFGLGANVATVDVGAYVIQHMGPPVFAVDKVESFSKAKVAAGRGVVAAIEYQEAGFTIRDIELVSVV